MPTRTDHTIPGATPLEAGRVRTGEGSRKGYAGSSCPNGRSRSTPSRPGFRQSQQVAWDWCGLVAVLVLFFSGGLAGAVDQAGRPAGEADVIEVARIKVDLEGAKNNVKVVRLRDGGTGFIVKRLGSGSDRLLTPEEFAELVLRQQSARGWLNVVLNITSPAGMIWVALGLGGQILFTGRMVVQWIVSEKRRRSTIPVSFWWMSLIGATMLLIYFVWRRDIVGILGQATGWFIYVRNLTLIYARKRG